MKKGCRTAAKPVKQRARGDTNLHSKMHDPKEVWVMGECVDCGTCDHPGCIDVSLKLAHTAARSEVFNQPTYRE